MFPKKVSIALQFMLFLSFMYFMVPLWTPSTKTITPVAQQIESPITVSPAEKPEVVAAVAPPEKVVWERKKEVPQEAPVNETPLTVESDSVTEFDTTAGELAIAEPSFAPEAEVLVDNSGSSAMDKFLDELENAADAQEASAAIAAPVSRTTSGNIKLSEDYTFPEVQSDGRGGYFVNANTDGTFPSEPSARLLGGATETEFTDTDDIPFITPGNIVSIRWNMYSWRTGELVDTSDTIAQGAPVKTIVPDLDDIDFQFPFDPTVVRVPEYLSETLVGRQVGDRLQVVFEYGMEDLPEIFDREDAYTLVIDIVQNHG